jgi:tetratricopeptide (TPR) repeat protein
MDQRELKAKLAATSTDEEKISIFDAYAEHLFGKEKYREAGDYFSKALSLAKQPNIKAYLSGQIGICHYNAGRDDEAFEMLLKSARLFDADMPGFMADMYGLVHFHLGSLYEYHGKLARSLEARKLCERHIDVLDKDTKWMLYSGISRVYEATGKHDAAIQYSQKAIQVLSDDDPSLAYLYESMGNNYMSLKQHHEAIKSFQKVIDLDPKFERMDDIQLKLADSYHELTNHRMALDSYKKLLELKQITGDIRNLTWLYAKIAHCHFSVDEFEKSLLMALEGLHRKPKDKVEHSELRSYLTNNYYELGRYKEAVFEGEKTLKISRRFPSDDFFYFRMALSYHKLGDTKVFNQYRSTCQKLFKGDGWNKYLEKLT